MGAVQSFAEDTYNGCSNLVSNASNLGSSVISIGSDAFNGIKGISGDLALTALTTISDGVFKGCNYSNATLTFSNNLISIGENAFSKSSGFIGDLDIPASVVSIGKNAFLECKGFSTLTLRGVVSIGEGAFNGCSGFIGVLNIPNTVVSIGKNAFKDCVGLTAVTFGNKLVNIGDGAFSGCVGIVSELNIPNTVQSIGNSAFYNCVGITSVVLGNVTTIGNDAFNGCSSLVGSTLVLPNTLESIGDRCFAGCVSFTNGLNIPNTVSKIGDFAFSGIEFGGQIVLSTNEAFDTLGRGVLAGCLVVGDLEIPDNLINIGEYALYYTGLDGELILPITLLEVASKVAKGRVFGGYISIELPITISFSGCISFQSPSLTAGISVMGVDVVEVTLQAHEPIISYGVAPISLIDISLAIATVIPFVGAVAISANEQLKKRMVPGLNMTNKAILQANNPNLKPYALQADINSDGTTAIGGLATADRSQPFGDNGAQDKPLGSF